MHNFILMTDSYKVSHAVQYPPGTTKVCSYQESRGGEFDKIVWFGLQYLIHTYLGLNTYEFFAYSSNYILEAERILNSHLGPGIFDRSRWERLADLGYIPLKIYSVPEGSVVTPGIPTFYIENTHPDFYWLTNYVETMLSQVWYPATVATQSYAMKQDILAALEKSGTPELVAFKLHDFGYRGSTSYESAALGGAAHLLNFRGTDTLAALELLDKYYYDHSPYKAPGLSIPASEHSTITSWGKAGEVAAYANMLKQYPDGLVACVSDSYDIYHACQELWGTVLHDEVLQRNGTLVIRPDSGDPLTVLPDLMRILANKFGYRVNDKGYLVLNDKVRVIQGDGIDRHSLPRIMNRLMASSFSIDNIAFGSGGGLLQKVNRDTCKFAIKCCAVEVNGNVVDVRKDPVTDTGKRSKTLTEVQQHLPKMQLVFDDGVVVNESFETVRARVV